MSIARNSHTRSSSVRCSLPAASPRTASAIFVAIYAVAFHPWAGSGSPSGPASRAGSGSPPGPSIGRCRAYSTHPTRNVACRAMDAVWPRRLRWRRRGAWLWPAFVAATVVDAVIGHVLPAGGDAESLAGVGDERSVRDEGRHRPGPGLDRRARPSGVSSERRLREHVRDPARPHLPRVRPWRPHAADLLRGRRRVAAVPERRALRRLRAQL